VSLNQFKYRFNSNTQRGLRLKLAYIFIALLFAVSPAFAQHGLMSPDTVMPAQSHTANAQHEAEGGADIVETILHHVSDANENHIATMSSAEDKMDELDIADANEDHLATIGGKHITLPLPCILINKETKKVSIFMSSAFHHAPNGIVDGYAMNHSKVVDAATGKRDTFYDLSITKNVFNMLTGFIILTVLFFSMKSAYGKRKGQAPKGVQAVLEPVVSFVVTDVIKQNIGRRYEEFVPFLLSVFFFILINNLLGLVPFLGGINSSGNISFTMVMALCSLFIINLNGSKDYWTHIFAMPGVPKWVLIILTPIEILGVFLKPAVLMLRLFGNITGGHIAVLSIASLIFIMGKMGESIGGAAAGGVVAFPILLFVNALELFVAFLQAYVFTLLSAIFIGAAVEEHHHAEHH
jgi:F-type H+-transporting ATPase subunit a